jgi:hypothetical protein
VAVAENRPDLRCGRERGEQALGLREEECLCCISSAVTPAPPPFPATSTLTSVHKDVAKALLAELAACASEGASAAEVGERAGRGR